MKKSRNQRNRNASVSNPKRNQLGEADRDVRNLCGEYKNLENPSNNKNQPNTRAKPNPRINVYQNPSQKTKRNASVAHVSRPQSAKKSSGAPYTNPFPKQKPQQTMHSSQSNIKTGYTNLVQTNPHTEDGREKIAKDTLQIIHDGKYEKYDPVSKKKDTIIISKDISRSKSNTKTFGPKEYENKEITRNKNNSKCEIKVIAISSFGAAKHLVKNDRIAKTCVLNFASATKPGGGFKNGRQAQEESLSRQSALYESIKDSKMYDEHKRRPNDNYYTDYMIYSPNVPVFRNDQDESLLSSNEYFTVNVITSAAPNKSKIDKEKYSMDSKPDLNKILISRIRKIIKCAIDMGNDALVLGAYGCGVFGNDPKEISKIFKQVLIQERFECYLKKVIFAIPGPHSENFKAFSHEFS